MPDPSEKREAALRDDLSRLSNESLLELIRNSDRPKAIANISKASLVETVIRDRRADGEEKLDEEATLRRLRREITEDVDRGIGRTVGVFKYAGLSVTIVIAVSGVLGFWDLSLAREKLDEVSEEFEKLKTASRELEERNIEESRALQESTRRALVAHSVMLTTIVKREAERVFSSYSTSLSRFQDGSDFFDHVPALEYLQRSMGELGVEDEYMQRIVVLREVALLLTKLESVKEAAASEDESKLVQAITDAVDELERTDFVYSGKEKSFKALARKLEAYRQNALGVLLLSRYHRITRLEGDLERAQVAVKAAIASYEKFARPHSNLAVAEIYRVENDMGKSVLTVEESESIIERLVSARKLFHLAAGLEEDEGNKTIYANNEISTSLDEIRVLLKVKVGAGDLGHEAATRKERVQELARMASAKAKQLIERSDRVHPVAYYTLAECLGLAGCFGDVLQESGVESLLGSVTDALRKAVKAGYTGFRGKDEEAFWSEKEAPNLLLMVESLSRDFPGKQSLLSEFRRSTWELLTREPK